MKLLLAILSLTWANIALAEQEQWPYPEDSPKPQKLSVGTASDRPIDISRFLLARGERGASLNASASHLAYLSNTTGKWQLWIKQLKSGNTKQLTFGNGVNEYHWYPDGEQLLYAADNNGDEKQAYYLINLEGTNEKVVLSHSNAYRQFGAFDETGRYFSYASTERNGRDFDIYLYDFKNEQSKIIFESEFGFYPRSWKPNSQKLIMTEVQGEDGQNVYLLDADSSKTKTLFKPAVSALFSDFNWTKDGSGFYFISNINGEMNQVLYHDYLSEKTTVVESNIHDLESVRLCSNDEYLVWVVNNNGFDDIYSKHLASGVKTKLSKAQGRYSLSCHQNNSKLVARLSSFDTPADTFVFDLVNNTKQTYLSSQMAGIDKSTLVKPEVVTFKARDGVTIQGLLYLPKEHNNKKPPLVIDIHGGPTAQSRASWSPLTQYLVGKGIAVFDINVRGSTGFGKTYARLDNQEKRLDSVRDLIDALKYFENDNRVDATNAAAIGGSYGGYMVNAVMGLYPSAFKAGASFVGVANWVRALQTASPSLKASDRIEYGDIREAKWQRFYEANSPINTVHQIKAPMFYQHGVNDPRDPVTESDEMVKALRLKNIPVTYLRFSDEGHRISKLENRVIFYRELANFLEKHL